jgi:biopolymer transport protein ExbD
MRQALPFLAPIDPPPLMEINMTPLIDVLLVLLIMLLINLPLATHAVKMDLTGGPGVQRELIHIDVDFDGSIYWNDSLIATPSQLEQYFRSAAAKVPQPIVQVNPDRRAKYDGVVKVLAMAQRNGLLGVGIAGNERFID